MLDYSTLLYRPIYNALADQAAQIAPASGPPFGIAALDKTAGVLVGGHVEVQSVSPAAVVMMVDLAAAGIDPAALDDGQITLNGVTWTIQSHKSAPSPAGEADGQLYLFLSE